uniref:Uncharacterized protein n=1 Tax=Acrobeloides nanus TaxID=290746 RepID=A0A914EP97_9BILA
PPIPPEIRQVLPSDTVTQLEAIHNDPNLDFMQKQQKIDQIMSSLPPEILDKIPPPPGFYNLPADVQQKLKDIQRNRTMTFEQKQQQTQQIIQSLPENLRRMLGPMGGGPPPRARMPPRAALYN